MNKLFIFSLGAAVGSLLTWKLLEEKYRRIAEEEIESVRERFKERPESEKIKVEVTDDAIKLARKQIEDEKYEARMRSHSRRSELYKRARELGYDINVEDQDSLIEKEDGSIWVGSGDDYIDPYVLTPDEFGEIESYDTKSWTFYSDSVITDELGEIVYDPESIIGDNLIHFGQYEDDSLHVRNENLECDYEIIKCDKAYYDLNERATDDV